MSAKSRLFQRGLEFRDAEAKAMNNAYCRFVHRASTQDHAKMSTILHMNVIGNPGVPRTDSELSSAKRPMEAHSNSSRTQSIPMARSSVIGDVVSPGTHVGRDVLALLAFAWEGKFLLGALRGFVAT